jgi:hypothetical protein
MSSYVSAGSELLLARVHSQNLREYVQKTAAEKSASLSIQTTQNLIALFSAGTLSAQSASNGRNGSTTTTRRPGFDFSDAPDVWALVFKCLLRVKTSLLLEENVLETLVRVYLASSHASLQTALLTPLLQLSQAVLTATA